MPLSRVLIISPNHLFREGLVRLLSKKQDLELVGAAVGVQEAASLVQGTRVDVVLFEQAPGGDPPQDMLFHLLDTPSREARVVTVSLDAGDMQIYRREQVDRASVENLVAALGSSRES